MFSYSNKIHVLPNWKGSWHQLNFLITLLLVTYLISGCVSTPSKQFYENPEFGISLEKPRNWDLAFYERSGTIVLEAENGIGNKDSARIEIYGYACVPILFNDPEEAIKSNIDRIRILYDLDSITIVQEPIRVETEDYEIVKAIISIPTISLPENSVENQVGDQGSNTFQTIDMFNVRDSNNNSIMVQLYKGNSEVLNVQAQEIINSIQITCSTEP